MVIGVRDGVAIIYVVGELLHHDSFLSRLWGTFTYDTIAKRFQRAVDHSDIHSIMLYVDLPGGQANGADQLAAMIYAARHKKPIAAYVSGMACSAAFWIATAASKVTISDMAILGSIGVAQAYQNTAGRDEQRGIERVGIRVVAVAWQALCSGQKFRRWSTKWPTSSSAPSQSIAASRLSQSSSGFGQGGVEIGKKGVRCRFSPRCDRLIRNGTGNPKGAGRSRSSPSRSLQRNRRQPCGLRCE